MEQNQELENYINSTKDNVKSIPDPERSEFMKKMFSEIPKYEGDFTTSTNSMPDNMDEFGNSMKEMMYKDKQELTMDNLTKAIQDAFPDHDPTAVDLRGNPLPLGVTRVGDSFRIDSGGGTLVHTGQGGLDLYKDALNTELKKVAMAPSSWSSEWFKGVTDIDLGILPGRIKSSKGKHPSNRIPPKKKRRKR